MKNCCLHKTTARGNNSWRSLMREYSQSSFQSNPVQVLVSSTSKRDPTWHFHNKVNSQGGALLTQLILLLVPLALIRIIRLRHLFKRNKGCLNGIVSKTSRYRLTLWSSSYSRTQILFDLSHYSKTLTKWQWVGDATTGSSKEFIYKKTLSSIIKPLSRNPNHRKEMLM